MYSDIKDVIALYATVSGKTNLVQGERLAFL